VKKSYLGAAILVLVALLAKFSPLLQSDFGLDIYLHDEYVVVPLANIIFWICIVVATGWLVTIGVRRKPTRLR
jgi:hypothetical protein